MSPGSTPPPPGMAVDKCIMMTKIMGIDFRRLIEAIDNNRLIIIDYIDYIDCLPMIDFHAG